MAVRRPSSWLLLLGVVALGLAGCEPYRSMTDQIPSQTRQATALLPKSPRYVGMVDLETVIKQIDEISDVHLADSLRQSDNPRLRTFLDATGMDPETDLKAVYGAVGDDSFNAVLFADLTPAQLDRYLEQASGEAGRATTYRDVPVYHLVPRSAEDCPDGCRDTLTLAFVQSGMIAAALDKGRVEAMIDRHQEQGVSFRENQAYMKLVERVGHGSTAWLVGRDVLQTALRDSGKSGEAAASVSSSSAVNGAGLQRVLSEWSDRVLGLSEAPPSLEGGTNSKVERLKSQIREQALSVTLTDETVEGEMYLTMRDETSASNVVDVARGAVAALRLSESTVNELQRDVLDEVAIERKGPVVHIQFAVGRKHLRQATKTAQRGRSIRREKSTIRRLKEATRRLGGITRARGALRVPRVAVTPCNLCADRPVYSAARTGEGAG